MKYYFILDKSRDLKLLSKRAWISKRSAIIDFKGEKRLRYFRCFTLESALLAMHDLENLNIESEMVVHE